MDRREEHTGYRGGMPHEERRQPPQPRGQQMDEAEMRRMRARARQQEAYGEWIPERPPGAEPVPSEMRGYREPYARARGGRRRSRGMVRGFAARLGSIMQRWAEEGGERLSRAGQRVEDWTSEGQEQLSRAGEQVRTAAEHPERIAGEEERPDRGSRGNGEAEGSYRGRGPKNYTRSDDRIHEDVCEKLSEGDLDASDIEVRVDRGEVTLQGTVPTKDWRRMAEDLSDQVMGVRDIKNDLRVRSHG